MKTATTSAWIHLTLALAGLVPLGACLDGGSDATVPPPPPSTAEVERAVRALASVPSVLGFEAADGWSATGGTLTSVTSPKSQGSRAARLASFTDARVSSLVLATDAAPAAEILLDLHISGPQPPSGWTASLSLSLFSPSRGLENGAVLGPVDVRSLPRGSFRTVRFPVPQPVREMLAEGATDIAFVLQAVSSVSTQVFGFDNLRAFAARPVATLPWWLQYCADATCGGLQPVVVHVCPQASPTCTPTRSTTLVPQVDGRAINGVRLFINTPADHGWRVVSGPVSEGGFVANSNRVIVKSDVDVTFSYYNQPAVWGGTTALDFVSLTITGSGLVSTLFRHPSYLLGDEVLELDRRGREIAAEQGSLAGIITAPGRLRATFVMSELVIYGEGNFSRGDNWISINYGNPPYIEGKGGIQNAAMPRFAHEQTHEMFQEIAAQYPGNGYCLNEGLADAFPYTAGFLPEADFGPVNIRPENNFDNGCAEVMDHFESHDAGNCPLWQVKRLGRLTREFARAMFHPQRAISFDSCDLRAARTGNAYVVLFTEAAGGQDMTAAVDLAEIPNAGSYEAAKAALGL
jgi:hypothetical protein